MFSPMTRTISCCCSVTVRSVPTYLHSIRASRSAGLLAATVAATPFTKSTNFSFLATKSVSALTSTTTPTPSMTAA